MPQRGDFVRVRTRRWLVEDERSAGEGLTALRLACVDDDAQGEVVEILWDAELDGSVLQDEGWASVARLGTDDPSVFSAYLRALRWNTATAADRDLFQAPFRAGIHQDAYQLLPLRKALRLPRVNLLIADDVGAGKTVEAGLVLREMLLRRRVDFVLVAAPAGMVRQWQDELEAKFGLTFTLIDREYLATLRRERGYTANPWSSGSRFIISHSLMADETYIGGLRDLLGNFRPRALSILDEAHHAAPSSGARYAVDSQFTRAVRGLAERFEHRLFLTATPHNGHSNSFSSLLEILDPQRFTRGVPVRPRELNAVMVDVSNPTCGISVRNFRKGSSSRSALMVCRTMLRNSFCPGSSPHMVNSFALAQPIFRRARPATSGLRSLGCSSGSSPRSPPLQGPWRFTAKGSFAPTPLRRLLPRKHSFMAAPRRRTSLPTKRTRRS
jgi:hypothetical protein